MAKIYDFNLMRQNGELVRAAGGVCYVAQAGSARKQALIDSSGAAVANPVALNQGRVSFRTADTANSVDLYIQSPTGHFRVIKGVTPGALQEAVIDDTDLSVVYVIPFAIEDTVQAVETDTGFDLPTGAVVNPLGQAVDVTVVDATEDIEVGLLSSEAGGDTDGFINNVSVATLGVIRPTMASGAITVGALLQVLTTGGTVPVPQTHVCDGIARSIVYLLSAGSDTARGFIILPVILARASALA